MQKNKYGETKEEALKNGHFDRLDFNVYAYVGRTGLLGPMDNRVCRFCEAEKGKSTGISCNSWNGKHTWNY